MEELSELVIELNMPPSVNRLYRRGQHGMVILTDEARAYHEHVKQVISDKYLHLLNRFPIHPEIVYGFSITLYFSAIENPGWFEFYTKGKQKGERKAKTRYKRVDIDNRVKFLQDTVTKTVGIPDDSQIFVGHQRKVKGNTDHVIVRLYVSDSEYFIKTEENNLDN